MNFSTDRDLLMLDPGVFRDVPFAGQQRLRVTDAVVSGVTLTSATADFAAAAVDVGCVGLLAGVPVEVIARVDAHTLTVSLPRPRLTDDAIPPGAVTDADMTLRTFAPQAAIVHLALLQRLGIDPDDARDGAITEDAVVSLSVMAQLEALGVLAHIHSAAVAIVGDNAALLQKAHDYRQRFASALRQSIILIDLNGDGVADAQRRFDTGQLQRV
jgi:hypothetical protein